MALVYRTGCFYKAGGGLSGLPVAFLTVSEGSGGGTGGALVGSFICGLGESVSDDGAGCGFVSDDSGGVPLNGNTGELGGCIEGGGPSGCNFPPSGWAFRAWIGVGAGDALPCKAWLTSSRALSS